MSEKNTIYRGKATIMNIGAEELTEKMLEKLPETSVIDLNSYVAKTKHPLFDKCGDIFENYMSEIMTNGMDPEEGWELMVEEINDTLADQ